MKMNFMPLKHTYEIIDQTFSRYVSRLFLARWDMFHLYLSQVLFPDIPFRGRSFLHVDHRKFQTAFESVNASSSADDPARQTRRRDGRQCV